MDVIKNLNFGLFITNLLGNSILQICTEPYQHKQKYVYS